HISRLYGGRRGRGRPTPFPYTPLFRSAQIRIESRGRAPELVLDVPRALNDVVRTIPGRYFDWGNHVWRAPLGVQAAITVKQLLRSEEHTSELQSREKRVCRLLLEKKKH